MHLCHPSDTASETPLVMAQCMSTYIWLLPQSSLLTLPLKLPTLEEFKQVERVEKVPGTFASFGEPVKVVFFFYMILIVNLQSHTHSETPASDYHR